MNTTQRYLLLFCASITFLSPSDSEYIKFFLATVLLFFGLSPKTWWNQIQPIKIEPSTHSTPLNEKLPDLKAPPSTEVDYQGNTREDNKQLIQISLQSLAHWMGLYRLRIAALANSYSQICMNYGDSKDDNWVLKTLKECAKYEGSIWDYKTPEEEKIAEEDALEAYDKKFSHLFSWCPNPDDREIIDMQIFLLVYSGACQGVIKRLKYFNEINFEPERTNELFKQYSIILDCAGKDYLFTTLLKYYTDKPEEEESRIKARTAFRKTITIWEEIENLLRSNLLIALDINLNVTNFFDELGIYRTLWTCFRERLLRKNNADLGLSVTRTEQDAKFREHFSNPSYCHIFH